MSAVDVELCDSYMHVVIRKDKNGEPFCVTTHSSGGSDSGFGGSGNSGGSDGGSGIGGGGGGGSGSSGGSSGGSTGGNNSGSDNNSDSGSNNSNNNGNGDGDGTNTNGDDNSNNNSGNNSDRFNNIESKIDPFKNFVIDNPPTLEDERKPDINLGDKTKFAGYGMNGKTDCLVLCKTICDNYNISNYIIGKTICAKIENEMYKKIVFSCRLQSSIKRYLNTYRILGKLLIFKQNKSAQTTKF